MVDMGHVGHETTHRVMWIQRHVLGDTFIRASDGMKQHRNWCVFQKVCRSSNKRQDDAVVW